MQEDTSSIFFLKFPDDFAMPPMYRGPMSTPLIILMGLSEKCPHFSCQVVTVRRENGR